jgi:hypothetical protein
MQIITKKTSRAEPFTKRRLEGAERGKVAYTLLIPTPFCKMVSAPQV